MHRHLPAILVVLGLLLVLTVSSVGASEAVKPERAYAWSPSGIVGSVGDSAPCLGGDGVTAFAVGGPAQMVFDAAGIPSLDVRQRIELTYVPNDPTLPTFEGWTIVRGRFPGFTEDGSWYQFPVPITITMHGSDGSVATLVWNGYQLGGSSDGVVNHVSVASHSWVCP